jgi:hypothetical protein
MRPVSRCPIRYKHGRRSRFARAFLGMVSSVERGLPRFSGTSGPNPVKMPDRLGIDVRIEMRPGHRSSSGDRAGNLRARPGGNLCIGGAPAAGS